MEQASRIKQIIQIFKVYPHNQLTSNEISAIISFHYTSLDGI